VFVIGKILQPSLIFADPKGEDLKAPPLDYSLAYLQKTLDKAKKDFIFKNDVH
jgi:hypothetical protein